MKSKLIYTIVSIVGILAIATACAAPAATEKNIPVSDIVAAVKTEDQFAMSFEIDEAYITQMTGLDFSMLEEYDISEPPNVSATILYIAKVKDAKDLPAVKTAFEKRLSLIQQSFEQYLPDQYDLAKKGQVVTEGNYIMLAIAQDTDQAVEAFRNVLK